jgi:hypothetical protein
MSVQTISPEDVVRKGKQLYEERIRPLVEEQHHGKFLAIDVETGDYEVAEKLLYASERLRSKRPQARLFGMRIGYPAAYRLGGRFRVAPP